MNTAEMIYQKAKTLPEPFALEVLDFIGYLEQKKLKVSPFPKTTIYPSPFKTPYRLVIKKLIFQ